MCSTCSSQEDSQQLNRPDSEGEDRSVPRGSHRIFGRTAASLSFASGAVWIFTAADARHGASLTLGYALWLSLALALSIAASAAACTWAVLKDNRRRDARQMRAIRNAVKVFLRDGDRAADGAMTAVQSLIDRSDRSNVTQFPRAHP